MESRTTSLRLRIQQLTRVRGSDDNFQTERRTSMNLAVHVPHLASWAAFLTVVAWMLVPTK
jgi:hypothetical protein